MSIFISLAGSTWECSREAEPPVPAVGGSASAHLVGRFYLGMLSGGRASSPSSRLAFLDRARERGKISNPKWYDMERTFDYSEGFPEVVISTVLAENCSDYNQNAGLKEVQEPIVSAVPEVRKIIERVLELEKDKLYMKVPKYINDDILQIVKEEVQ